MMGDRHDDIERQVREYEARGGNIEEVAPRRAVSRSRGTGVVHVHQTMSGFGRGRPSKAEARMARLNPRTSDPAGGAGGGTQDPLIAGQIAAGFAMGRTPVRSIERLVGATVTRRAVYQLALYKHTGDRDAYRTLWNDLLTMIAAVAVDEGWRQPPAGRLSSVAHVAIDDICHPGRYLGRTDRQWARRMGLPDHKAWQNTWRRRYQITRSMLQELDSAADAHVEKFT